MRTFRATPFFNSFFQSKIERCLATKTGLLSDCYLRRRWLSNNYLSILSVPQTGVDLSILPVPQTGVSFRRSPLQTPFFLRENPLLASHLSPSPSIPLSHPLLPSSSFSTASSFSSSSSSLSSSSTPSSSPPKEIHALADTNQSPPLLQTPLLSVYTSDHRAAGTSSTPLLRILGEKSIQEYILVGDFSRGSGSFFDLGLDLEEAGEVRAIEVVSQPLTMPSDRWLLEKVVLSVPGEEDVVFACHEWIGSRSFVGQVEDADDCTQEKVVLFPLSHDSFPPPYEWGENDELHLSLGRSGVPSEDKIKRGFKSVVRKNNGYAGEDAYFISHGTRRERTKEKRDDFDYSMPNCYYLGVADGVGMWRTHGVDSALYSQHLLHSAREAIGQFSNPDSYKVLTEAWEKTTIVHGVKGSCTVCLFRVGPDGWVDGVQIGDSGLLLVRDGKPVYRTSEQEHLFGFPFQLGHVSTTKPKDCIHHRFRVSPGDVIVMGSDGLFDNISDRVIAHTVQEFSDPPVGQNSGGRTSHKSFSGDELSRKLVTTAYLNSIQKEKDTPWSRAAQKEWDFPISGGKEDDVVVVVARIECYRGMGQPTQDLSGGD